MRSQVKGGVQKLIGKLYDYSRNNNPYLSGIDELEEIFSRKSLKDILVKLHENDDVDTDGKAHHHTLGLLSNQALPGSFGESILRIGGIYFFALAGSYGGFLECDGATYDYNDYPHLGQYLGSLPDTTFNVPTVTLAGTVAYICYSTLPKADG